MERLEQFNLRSELMCRKANGEMDIIIRDGATVPHKSNRAPLSQGVSAP